MREKCLTSGGVEWALAPCLWTRQTQMDQGLSKASNMKGNTLHKLRGNFKRNDEGQWIFEVMQLTRLKGAAVKFPLNVK